MTQRGNGGINVQNVKYSGFSVPPLTTASANVVNRKRSLFPSQLPGPYTGLGINNNGYYTQAEFRLYDQECFVDLFNLRLTGQFQGNFASSSSYGIDQGPDLDQSIQALIRNVAVGSVQGLTIDQILNYNLLCNVIEAHSETASAKRYDAMGMSKSEWYGKGVSREPAAEALDIAARLSVSSALTERYGVTPYTALALADNANNDLSVPISSNTIPQDIIIDLKQVSIFNKVRFFPLFVMKYGLRLLIDFEDPRIAFYNNKRFPEFEFVTTLQHTGNTPVCVITTVAGTATTTGTIAFTFTGTEGGVVCSGFNFTRLIPHVTRVQVMVSGNMDVIVTGTVLTYASATPTTWNAASLTLLIDEISHSSNTVTIASNIQPFIPATTPISVTGGTASDPLVFKYRILEGGVSPADSITGAPVTDSASYWTYTLKNLNLLGDLVRPSSDVHAEYFRQFDTPEGIIYPYVGINYHKNQIPASMTGEVKWVIPVSKRSVKGILLVISDPLSLGTGNDFSIFNFPCLSSFQMAGLTSAKLTVGSTSFPYYDLNMKSMLQISHLPEIQTLYNLAGVSNYLPSYHPGKLNRYSRCYGLATNPFIDAAQNAVGSTVGMEGKKDVLFAQRADVTGATHAVGKTVPYYDTSRFILGISTMKLDGDYLSGIDTTQSGSMVLSLTFANPISQTDLYNPVRPPSRDRIIHCFVLHDAALQIQNNKTQVSS